MTHSTVSNPATAAASAAARPPAVLVTALIGLLAGVLLVLSTLLGAGAAHAAQHAAAEDADAGQDASDFAWSVQPSSKDGPDGRDQLAYTLNPGEQSEDYIAVSNVGEKTITVRMRSLDAKMTADGAFTLPPSDVEATDAGAWISLKGGDDTYKLKPGTRVDIPIIVEVPEGATPGEHAAGVVASVVTQADGGGDAPQFAVDRRVGVRAYVTVPGDIAASIEVTDVRVQHRAGLALSAPAEVTYTVRNTGNVRVSGSAAVRIDGLFGLGGAAADPAPLPELLPGAELQLSADFDDILTSGLVTATVEIDATVVGDDAADVTGERTATASTVSIPWLIVIALVLIIAIVVLLVLRSRRMRRRLAETAERAAAAEAALAAASEPAASEPTAASEPASESADSDVRPEASADDPADSTKE